MAALPGHGFSAWLDKSPASMALQCLHYDAGSKHGSTVFMLLLPDCFCNVQVVQ